MPAALIVSTCAHENAALPGVMALTITEAKFIKERDNAGTLTIAFVMENDDNNHGTFYNLFIRYFFVSSAINT